MIYKILTVLIGFFVAVQNVDGRVTSADSSSVVVEFTYRSTAFTNVVYLAGSFNLWGDENGTGVVRDSSFAMRLDVLTGEWTKAETLAIGIYEYAFVENGNVWKIDPLNPRVVPGTVNLCGLEVTSPMIFHFQPLEGLQLSDETPEILALLFTSLTTAIDSASIRLFIDGGEVAGAGAFFNRAKREFRYKPPASLGRGDHTARLEVLNNLGKYTSATSHFGIGTSLITRGPYLSMVSQNSMVVSWFTRAPVPSIVQFGRTISYGSAVVDTSRVSMHSLTLTGLTPSSLYHYRVISNDTTSDYTFATAARPGEPFVFAAYGDVRTNHDAHVSVIRRIVEQTPRFLLNTGDLVSVSTESEWDAYFNDICKSTRLAETTPIYSTLGNHEGNSILYYNYLYLPHNNPANTIAYYSFEYGNAHIICLDSEIPYNVGSEQYNWLVTDLKSASEARFRFIFVHRPLYSSSQHGSEINLRNTLSPLCESEKVDIVFSGHDHVYERTNSINGVTYIVTGGGGAPLYDFYTSNSWTAYKESAYHFCKLQIDSNICRMWMIRSDGVVRDSLTIVKSGTATSVIDKQGVIQKHPRLYQNYPNPFNPETVLTYSLDAPSYVTLEVFDIIGRRVKELLCDVPRIPGFYQQNLNASDLPGGVYFCRLVAVSASQPRSTFEETKAMVLLK